MIEEKRELGEHELELVVGGSGNPSGDTDDTSPVDPDLKATPILF